MPSSRSTTSSPRSTAGWGRQAAEEKRKLALGHLAAARSRVNALLAKTTDHELRAATDEVRKLERLATDGSAPEDGAGRRARRSPDDLQADAAWLVAHLRANPGSRSSAAQAATGVAVKPPLTVRTFIEKYGPKGVPVKTQGERAGMTYRVA